MREIKFRGLSPTGNLIQGEKLKIQKITEKTLMQFTGFSDKNGKDIYEGDILSDFTDTDEGYMKSYYQVYWCEKHGAWKLDFSLKQDKSEGAYLYEELEKFDYEFSGNIHIKTTQTL